MKTLSNTPRSEAKSRFMVFVVGRRFPPSAHPNERCSIEVAPDIGADRLGPFL